MRLGLDELRPDLERGVLAPGRRSSDPMTGRLSIKGMRDLTRRATFASAQRSTSVRALLFALVVAMAVMGATVAFAAPGATTSAATDITSTTATLNGRVSPDQSGTQAFFQYGTTAEYGSQTPTESVNGNASKDVSAAVTGLAPSTPYHFRMVATSAGGTSNGTDMTFTTTATGAPPAPANSVTIAAKPTTITFTRATTITGQLRGDKNAGVEVTLEENPYPYTAGFTPTSTKTTTSATGAYSLLAKPSVSTHYRVTAKAKPPVTSAEVAIRVRVKVTFHLSDRTPAKGQRVRFYGTVLPGHDGRLARIQRRTRSGAWKTISTATLVAATPLNGVARSSYSKRLRIGSSGSYRVRMAPADGDHIAGTSGRRLAVAH